ncbi:MAG: hypothetical protein ABEN55_20405 [Bradymonadaceae bacterium]
MKEIARKQQTLIEQFECLKKQNIEERLEQLDKWGRDHDAGHDPHDWMAIVVNHVSKGLIEPNHLPPRNVDAFHSLFIESMTEVAAAALAAIETARHNNLLENV